MTSILLAHSTLLRVAAFAGAFIAFLGVKLIRDRSARKSWDDGSGLNRTMKLKDYLPGGALIALGLLIAIACLIQPEAYKVL